MKAVCSLCTNSTHMNVKLHKLTLKAFTINFSTGKFLQKKKKKSIDMNVVVITVGHYEIFRMGKYNTGLSGIQIQTLGSTAKYQPKYLPWTWLEFAFATKSTSMAKKLLENIEYRQNIGNFFDTDVVDLRFGNKNNNFHKSSAQKYTHDLPFYFLSFAPN